MREREKRKKEKKTSAEETFAFIWYAEHVAFRILFFFLFVRFFQPLFAFLSEYDDGDAKKKK